ncbi:hypothetical protein ACP4OV_014109 [Aristida adscensionis]
MAQTFSSTVCKILLVALVLSSTLFSYGRPIWSALAGAARSRTATTTARRWPGTPKGGYCLAGNCCCEEPDDPEPPSPPSPPTPPSARLH